MGRSEAAYFAGLTSRGILQTCPRDSQHQRTFKPFFVLFCFVCCFGLVWFWGFVCFCLPEIFLFCFVLGDVFAFFHTCADSMQVLYPGDLLSQSINFQGPEW